MNNTPKTEMMMNLKEEKHTVNKMKGEETT